MLIFLVCVKDALEYTQTVKNHANQCIYIAQLEHQPVTVYVLFLALNPRYATSNKYYCIKSTVARY